MAEFYVGLDLGQASDFTAAIVLEKLRPERENRVEQRSRSIPQGETRDGPRSSLLGSRSFGLVRPEYRVRFAERRRGAPYPEIAAGVRDLLREPPLAGRASLVVDATGVGAPVIDALRAFGLRPIAISIHGGAEVRRDLPGRPLGLAFGVPKRDLVAAVQVLLQSGRLKFADGLPDLATLKRELLAFKARIDPQTAHDSYAAWREADHDDLVLAVALACWYATQARPAPTALAQAAARGW
jgi:hypothetical protein